MSTEITEEKRGISRRDLIKKGAVAGAIVWTVPLIESVPAYAATGSQSLPITCSYIVVVYTISGAGPYALKLGSGCGANATSSDDLFSTTCNGSTYDNYQHGPVRKDGVAVTSGDCSQIFNYFTFSGNSITPKAGSGVSIIFAVAHNGSFTGHFAYACPPTAVSFSC